MESYINNTTANNGVEVINNGKYTIRECYVELVSLFEENKGEYINTYEEMKSQLPCILAWQIHNDFIYGEIEIEKTDSRYLVISYVEGTETLRYFSVKGEKNFVYAWPAFGHVVAEIRVRGKISTESLSSKSLFVEMFTNGNTVVVNKVTAKLPELSSVLRNFSLCLDEVLKDKKNSSPSISFLNRVRVSPPFLGLEKSIISPEIERDLVEFFLAKQFVETRKGSIRGGKGYQVKPDDESLEGVSKKIYGNERFSEQLIEANDGATTLPPIGSYMAVPIIDISDPFRLSATELERRRILARDSSIEPTIDKLASQFFLVKHETMWLMETIYEAAQKTRSMRE